MGKMRSVAYCRVSTDGQVGEDKYGIDSQKEDIKRYCEANDIEIVEWFIEEGVSGAKDSDSRPELSKILNGAITNPPIEAVIVSKNDRLARDIEKYFGFKYLLKRNSIDVISVSEDFGSAGPFKPIYEAISAAFAEMEKTFITARMSGGRRVKASKGGYSGGKAPFGYSSERKSGVLTVNEKEAEVVRRIFALREREGKTMKEICEILNSGGYRTRKGDEFKISTIQYILGNRRTYQGEYRYGKSGEWVKGSHEPILKDYEA